MRPEYIIGIVLALLVIVGGGALLFSAPEGDSLFSPLTGTDVGNGNGEKAGEPYVEIVNPSGFVNTDGITIGELVGKKIILVDFMTYSCINCQRTFPYVKAWYEKYKDQGLEIVAIHTPEFAFEKDIDNVQKAMEENGINYPVVLDNDYATWRAYKNNYWPRKYLIDINGSIVYDHIGEGAYEETEKKIQELLKERAEVLGLGDVGEDSGLATDSISDVEISARSPETYFGSARNEYLANGTPGKSGVETFEAPTVAFANRLYLVGTWNIDGEYSEAVSDARVIYRFNAREVYIVAEADSEGVIEVYQDGELVTDVNRGESVGEDGFVVVRESRLYKLIKNEKAGEHVLELRVSPGIRLYAFTFG